MRVKPVAVPGPTHRLETASEPVGAACSQLIIRRIQSFCKTRRSCPLLHRLPVLIGDDPEARIGVGEDRDKGVRTVLGQASGLLLVSFS